MTPGGEAIHEAGDAEAWEESSFEAQLEGKDLTDFFDEL
jgi:hypothetical protein